LKADGHTYIGNIYKDHIYGDGQIIFSMNDFRKEFIGEFVNGVPATGLLTLKNSCKIQGRFDSD